MTTDGVAAGESRGRSGPLEVLQRIRPVGGTGGGAAPVDAHPGALDVLERLRRPRPRPGECCELCGVDVADEHSHIVNVTSRSLLCACRPCYLLFQPGGAGGGRYRAVPERYLALPAFALSRAQWDGLQIPVSVAFFFTNSSMGEVVGFYPGPAGATESLFPLAAWTELRDDNPVLDTLQPDVEALLVRAPRDGDVESFIVPIDACYELVGQMRRLWRGFDGGQEANEAIGQFFADVAARAQ